jgi:hypothetical protein
LRKLPKLDRENQYVVLVRRADWARWEPAAANFEKLECNIDPYTVDEQLRLSGILHDLRPDLVHLVTPNAAVLYDGPRVVTVHDLTLLDYDTSRGTGLAKWIKASKRIPSAGYLAIRYDMPPT